MSEHPWNTHEIHEIPHTVDLKPSEGTVTGFFKDNIWK